MEYQLITQNNANLIDTNEPNVCSICFDPLNENIVTLDCKHELHISCYDELIKTSKKCPCCRAKINTDTTILWNSCGCYYKINKSFKDVLDKINAHLLFVDVLQIMMWLSSFVLILSALIFFKNFYVHNYCDNDTVQCGHFKTYGTISNTSEVSRDSILYIYDYTYNGHNNNCYTRINYDLSYKKIHNLYEQSIGEQLDIFVNKKHPEKCIINYASYNVKYTAYQNYFFCILCVLGALFVYKCLIEIYIKYLKHINNKDEDESQN